MQRDGSSSRGGGPRFIILVVLALVGATSAGGLALIHTATQPPIDSRRTDPEDVLLRTEDVLLQSADGVPLAGWFVRGRPGAPAIVLCHDLGGSRWSLLNEAVALSRDGYPLLMFDFRRHGDSGGRKSTLGVKERLDLRAAIAYLKTRKDIDRRRFGGWGIGMGAYALALEAADDPEIVALALDSVYPDVPSQVNRLIRRRVPGFARPLVPALGLLYNVYFGCRLSRLSLADRVQDLAGRNLLLIAGTDAPDRFAEERRLYDALPEVPGGGKNLLELKVSGVGGLYAEDRKAYDEGIRDFFSNNLPLAVSPGDEGGGMEVVEK